MMAPDPERRATASVNGVLLLDKPAGLTSNQALQKVKRLLRARKAGHTGSLDPAATGMLPLCFGEATKICAYILDADKTYRVTASLGESTNTGDGDGDVIATALVPELDAERWREIFATFCGEIEQIPPMFSALKVGGKRLYELARQGQTIDRAPRRIRIHELRLLEVRGKRLVFRVRCSKGTYVRTLVEDLARAAGTLAYTAALHRETVAGFKSEDMLDLADLQRMAEVDTDRLQACLIAPDRALMKWPSRNLPTEVARRFADGQCVSTDGGGDLGTGEPVRVYGPENAFLGVGELTADGRLAPRRIFRIQP